MRFPEFSGEWDSFKLVELGKFIGGGTPSSSNLSFWTGSIPWISSSDIKEDNINNISISRYITEEAIEKSATKYCPAPVILIVSRVGVGKVALSHTSLCTSQDFCNIIEIKCHPVFLSYNLLRTMKRKSREVQGTSIKGITSDELQKMRVFIPKNKDEQNKISNLLTLLDERIATQNKIIEDLKKLKSAIIEKTFNENYSNKIRLRDVGSYIRGLTYSSDDVVESNGIFVMRSNNIINGSSLDYHNNIVSVNKQILTEQQLQTGDIVICMANGSSSLVGKSSFYDGDCSTPITVGAFCGIYRSKEPIVKWLFQTNKYRRYIWNSLQGGNGAIANLNGDDILRMSFSIPATPAKDNRIKLLTSVDTLLESNISLCDLYISQKLYLLRQMFI
ncbi:restriction endonuclease subunit S [Bacteroides fragilis]|uniref:restriction endonuclease subunit S n=1 Tax=Bacteroides fragilis TaxID=817 RepID=UPI000451F6E1|nr:restriction endonuclease subunit S [Bacteroides fragilis]EXZ03203.1 type I restriction modification DNA specificity domain protein [Bacteroides fragilis str. DS-208]